MYTSNHCGAMVLQYISKIKDGREGGRGGNGGCGPCEKDYGGA